MRARLPILLALLGACSPDTGIKVYNSTPEANIGSHGDGAVVDAGATVQLWGTVSDDSDDTESLMTTWYEGSTALCPSQAPDADGRTTCDVVLEEGEHTIVLEVLDPDNASATARVTLVATVPEVENSAPTCGITGPADGGSALPGETVSFTGVVADGESEPPALGVLWSSDLDGVLDETAADAEGNIGFTTAALSYGAHAIHLLVTDAQGLRCEDDITLNVGQAPTVTIDDPADGSRFGEGEDIVFLATVGSDATAAEDLSLVWSSDLDGELDTSPSDSDGAVVFSSGGLSPGSHTITLEATDEEGLTSRDSIELVINGQPSAPGVSISPASASPNDDLTASIDVESVDPEGSTVGYTYAWTRDGAVTSLSTATVDAAETSDGETWTVTVTPNDGELDGPAGTASVTIGNSAPVLADVTLTPDPAYEGDTMTCTPGAATDADGDPISYLTAWSINGGTIAATSTTLSSTWFEKADDVKCTVTPTDGMSSGTAVGSNTVTVENTAPAVSSVALSPTNPSVGDTVSCGYVFSDADGDSDRSTVAWTVNGASAGTGTTLPTSFVGGDTIVCTVTPYDGDDTGTAASATVTVGNSAPVLSGASLTPTTTYAGDTMTCTPGTATDADGDAVSYTYAWTVDGLASSRTASTLPSTFFSKDDAVLCTVTPTDGLSTGAPVNSNTVTISNTAPSASGLSISPSSPVATSTLTCAWTFTDADGDADLSTVVWKVNGSSVGTGATLSGAFVGGDSVQCVVTPNDGDDAGSSASKSVTIGNTAPSLSGVTLTPTTAYEGDTMTCTPGTATDVDGDSVSYATAWIVNGANISRTSSTLSSTYFSKGDTVKCSVTPDDGTVSGAAVASNTVTVSNSTPTVSSVAISPSTATAATALSCSYSFSDADSDSDASTIAWKINGASAGTGSSLSSGYNGGDVVSCTVTPNDGAVSGTAASASVTITNSAPSLSSVTLTPTTAYEGDTLTCTPGTATDADGDTVTYSYSWTVDGANPGVTSATLSSAYFAKNNAVRCAVTPTDGTTSGTATASNTVTISNTAPSLSGVTLTPTTAYEGDTLTCTPGSSSDGDGDSVSFTYAWIVNGATNSRTSSTLSSTYFSKGDTVKCSVTPNDGAVSGAAVASNTVTVSNSTPSVSSVLISPTSATATTALTCSYSFSDADGDLDSSTITWKINGVSAGTGTTLSTGYGGGDVVSCTVTPYDGAGSGTASSASVTITNTAPSLSSVTLTPTTAYEGDTLTCTPGTATDADGDTITYTYTWTVDSASPGVTSSTLSSAHFVKNNVVRCAVTPNDGTVSGTAAASNTVTISNTAPTISSVTLSPSVAYTNDTLSVSVSASDADGDPVTYTYAWKVNGSLVSTGATLSGATSFSKDDVVTVDVTPNDGTSAGTAMTASRTISNTAPGAPGVEVDPSLYADGGTDDLLCVVLTDSADVDGDTMTYTVSWEVDGLPYPAGFSGAVGPDTTEWTDDTVPAADSDLGRDWVCTVTPDDGDTEGSVATASVEVLDFYEVGYSTPGTSLGLAGASYLLGPSVTVASDTTLYALGGYLNTAGNSSRIALYTNSAGVPSTLVAYTDVFTTVVGKNEVWLSTPVALPAGTYWVMAVYSASTYIYYGSTSTGAVKYKSASYSSTPSTSFGTASSYTGYPPALYLEVAD